MELYRIIVKREDRDWGKRVICSRRLADARPIRCPASVELLHISDTLHTDLK